jgi:hypothetical protein
MIWPFVLSEVLWWWTYFGDAGFGQEGNYVVVWA